MNRASLLLLASASCLLGQIEVKETAKWPADGGWFGSGATHLAFGASPEPGDLMLVGFRSNASTFNVTPPTEWTAIGLPPTNSAGHFLRLFWKIASSNEPSVYTFSVNDAVRVMGFRIGGADPQQPIHAAGGRKFSSASSVVMSTQSQSNPTPVDVNTPSGSLLIGWKAVDSTVTNTVFSNGLANVEHQASNQFLSTGWKIHTGATTDQNSTCSWTTSRGGTTALVVVREANRPTREYIRLGQRAIAIESGDGGGEASVTPASIRLKAGEAQSFVAGFSPPVVWSIAPSEPESTYGSISPSGIYTAPATIGNELTLAVEARQTAGGPVLASASIVLEPASLVVTPATYTIQQPSQILELAANMAVTWSISPAVGTITPNGSTAAEYTAPSTIPSNQTVTVTATSTGNPTLTSSILITLQAAQTSCAVSPPSLSFGHASSETTISLTDCPGGHNWTATNNGLTWISFGPPPYGPSREGTGNGSFTVLAAVNNSVNSRSGHIIVDGQQVAVSQGGGPVSVVTLSATEVTLSHGESHSFVASINGSPDPGDVNWTKDSGPGTIVKSGYSGVYTAPATVDPNNAVAVVRATDPVGTGTATATINLVPYEPPLAGSFVVAPTSGSSLSQTFAFSVGNVAGVSVTRLDALITPTFAPEPQLQNACQVSVWIGTPLGHEIRVLENQGSAYSLGVYAGQQATAQNSQCRVLAESSSVTVNGAVTTVQLRIEFKPGFIGQMKTGASTTNSTGYLTQFVELGTWNLSANVQSLPPSGAITAPAAGATVGGDVVISGWALDNTTRAENAITNVQVFIDNVLQPGLVTMNQPHTICGTYPGRLGCPNVGWTYSWNSRTVANGTRTIKIRFTDGDNPPKTAEITRNVTVNNPPTVPITVQPATTFARGFLSGAYNPPYPQFTAYRGANVLSTVLWSLNPPWSSSGSITSAGVYTPGSVWSNPTGTQIQIIATNPSDATDKGYAYAILMGILAGGQQLMELSPGQQVQYMTQLGSVTYTLSPNIGNITYYGLYTHNGSGYTPGTIVTITATQVGNSNVRETAYVRLW